MEVPQWRLRVHVQRAVNLRSADANGFSDPFFKLSVGDQPARISKILKKTLSPEWDESFSFSLSQSEFHTLPLTLRIYDWDLASRDDFLGHFRIQIKDLVEFGLVNPHAQFHGQLRLSDQAPALRSTVVLTATAEPVFKTGTVESESSDEAEPSPFETSESLTADVDLATAAQTSVDTEVGLLRQQLVLELKESGLIDRIGERHSVVDSILQHWAAPLADQEQRDPASNVVKELTELLVKTRFASVCDEVFRLQERCSNLADQLALLKKSEGLCVSCGSRREFDSTAQVYGQGRL